MAKDIRVKGNEPTEKDQELIQERYVEMQLIARQMDQVKQQLQMIDEQTSEVRQSTDALRDLSALKSGDEIMVPVANGIFAQGTIQESQKLLVGVGANVIVEKDVRATIEILNKRLTTLETYREELTGAMMRLEIRTQSLETEMRAMLAKFQ